MVKNRGIAESGRTTHSGNKNNKLKRLVQSINNMKVNQHNRLTQILCSCVNSLITKRRSFIIGCKKNKGLFLLIDRLNIVSIHDII